MECGHEWERPLWKNTSNEQKALPSIWAYSNLALHHLSLHQRMTSGNHTDTNQPLVTDKRDDTTAALHFI